MPHYVHYAACFFILASLSSQLAAKSLPFDNVQKLETVSSTITEIITKTITKHIDKDFGSVLVVFDIDDTLLESNSFIGSDTWYNWQRGRDIEKVEGGTTSIDQNDKFSCLHSKLGVLYEIGSYHATEDNAASIVSQIQTKFDVVALTSRSPDYRAGTTRELTRANFEFYKSHLMPQSHSLSYDLNDGRRSRPVTYEDGIIMSTGLNKGVVLEDILQRLDRTYTTIFFIDDSKVNISNMIDTWIEKETMMVTFHYTGVEKKISEQDIRQSRKSRTTFNAFLEVAFPNRFTMLNEGNCD
jgi:hypothetical protein